MYLGSLRHDTDRNEGEGWERRTFELTPRSHDPEACPDTDRSEGEGWEREPCVPAEASRGSGGNAPTLEQPALTPSEARGKGGSEGTQPGSRFPILQLPLVVQRESQQRVDAAQPELAADVVAVMIHRAWTDAEKLRDLGGGLVLGHQLENPPLRR